MYILVWFACLPATVHQSWATEVSWQDLMNEHVNFCASGQVFHSRCVHGLPAAASLGLRTFSRRLMRDAKHTGVSYLTPCVSERANQPTRINNGIKQNVDAVTERLGKRSYQSIINALRQQASSATASAALQHSLKSISLLLIFTLMIRFSIFSETVGLSTLRGSRNESALFTVKLNRHAQDFILLRRLVDTIEECADRAQVKARRFFQYL